MARTAEPDIRPVGILALVLAYFHVRASLIELTPFLRWTVHTRIAVTTLFVISVVLGVGEPTVLLVGPADVAGAVWTCLALCKA